MMSAENDRIRRELGFDLIEAERKAAAGQPQPAAPVGVGTNKVN